VDTEPEGTRRRNDLLFVGMFEDAAQALEEVEPEDKTRNEVLYARFRKIWLRRSTSRMQFGAQRASSKRRQSFSKRARGIPRMA
jgi:hypothetical protein